VRGARLHVVEPLGRDGELIRPGMRLISAAIGALAIGFALGLQAVPPGVSDSETIQPKNFDPWASLGSQIPATRRLRVASLETDTVFESATEDRDRQSELATSTTGRAASAEAPAIDSHVASFDERFAGAADSRSSRQTAETEERANHMLLPSPDLGGHATARRFVGQSARGLTPLPTSAPAGVSKKQLHIAEASEDSSSSPDADGHTAIYDIVAHKVYLPNGQRLEAHSGFGHYLDDPRYVSEKDRGPTPPNVYDLSLREEPFHGVRAIRLIPVGGGNMFGREGMLAHSYMLGPNGQSNGCVSFSDYPAFLDAVLSGEINRLVVVEHLATVPSPKTALGWLWLPETIKALFRRS
jgi:type VI secretion system (T6SS) effector TldE1-like protein